MEKVATVPNFAFSMKVKTASASKQKWYIHNQKELKLTSLNPD